MSTFNIDTNFNFFENENEGLTFQKESVLQKASKNKKIIDAQLEEVKAIREEKDQHMKDMLDTEYYFCVYFKNQKERKEFLQKYKIKDTRYIPSDEFINKVLK